MVISKDTTIEELVRVYPNSVRLLMEKGIKCLACGEPIWGTLETVALDEGWKESEIIEMIDELECEIMIGGKSNASQD